MTGALTDCVETVASEVCPQEYHGRVSVHVCGWVVIVGFSMTAQTL